MWTDDTRAFIELSSLRLACPCAGCSGETDALGNVYSLKKTPLSSTAFEILQYELIGRYGVRFFWKDGHHDGIYTFDFLGALGDK